MEEISSVSNEDIFSLLKGVAAQNTEIKSDINQIKEDNRNLAQYFENLNNKVEALAEENKKLKKELLDTQKKLKRNNIIIFGVQEEEQEDIKSVVIQLLNQKLSIILPDSEINNTYRIGQRKNNTSRAILVEFIRNFKKQEIFKNITKLRGSGISIANDLTVEERQSNRILQKHLRIAREKQYNAKIIRHKLIINGETYTPEQLQSFETEERPRHLSNSLPGTPTYSENQPSDGHNIQAQFTEVPVLKSGNSKQKSSEKYINKEDRKVEEKEIKTSVSNTTLTGGSLVFTRSKRNQSDRSVSSPPAKKVK